jgi:ABC-type transport system involved in cytochrome c biogenesis permease component
MKTLTLRTAAVLHAIIALTVLLALTRMDNSQLQAAAAYMWAGCAVLLAVGTFTSGKEDE